MTNETELNPCGCCHLPAAAAPDPLYNPPGQDALRYRMGVHSSFLQRMQRQLSAMIAPDGDHAGRRPLLPLTTRASDDFAIALLDAWAVVGDVLTFYQERIANEGFLRTATERRSLLELARAIGYELKPGVAAEAYLAFTLDTTPGAPTSGLIAAGTQVQSLPAQQGELPQTFETSADFTAYASWNAITPRLIRPQIIPYTATSFYIAGTDHNLKAGDLLLLVHDTFVAPRFVKSVTLFDTDKRTLVALSGTVGLGTVSQVFVLREKVGIFGHNAPHFDTIALPERVTSPFHDWDAAGWQIWHSSLIGADDTPVYYSDADLYLERVVSGVTAGGYVVAMLPGGASQVYLIEQVNEKSLTEFGLSGKATGLVLTDREGVPLEDEDKPTNYLVRTTTIYLKSEELTLSEEPINDSLPAGALFIDIGGDTAGLLPDQLLAFSGVTPEGAPTAEIVTLRLAFQWAGVTFLWLDSGLQHSYARAGLTINANVVRATHGETTLNEAVGSGQGAQAHQQFTLRKALLTHISAATPAGASSELTVYVNGVVWQQVPSLYDRGPEEKVYTVRLDNDGKAHLHFGDGQMGARLPTGQENVKATYRSGIGLAGQVGANSLTLLKKRPFGVRSVTNPLAASGAEDPETLDDARHNAPLTALTLERIVSWRDFEDFASAYAGIGKAQATAVWNGEQEILHLTIAASNGDPIAAGSTLWNNLRDAIQQARDPRRPVQLASFEKLTFDLTARVKLATGYVWETVQAALTTALSDAFTFERRAFGQAVTEAEIIARLHTVEGVEAVDVEVLTITGDAALLHSRLTARVATYDPISRVILPAQLLLLNEAGVTLTEMS